MTTHYRRSTQYAKAPCGTEIESDTLKTGRVEDVTCRVCLQKILFLKKKEVRRLEERINGSAQS